MKAAIGNDASLSNRLEERHLFQNYKQLQFIDTLALYFNRIHRDERKEQTFEHVPLNAQEDAAIKIRPNGPGVYALSPFPFAPDGAEFAYGGRRISAHGNGTKRGWREVLKQTPTEWERFRLVAA